MASLKNGAAAYAAAVDHSADAWRAVVDQCDLATFGEPPAFVVVDGALFVAAELPIYVTSVVSGLPSTGSLGQHEWLPIPDGCHDTIESAVAWARESVGSWGRPPAAVQRPLRGDVDDEPQDLRTHERWKFGIARLPRYQALIHVPQPATHLTAWLQALHLGITRSMQAEFTAAGGHVHWQQSGEELHPYSLMVNEFCARRPGGRLSQLRPDEHSWHERAEDIGEGRAWRAVQAVRAIDRWALPDRYRLGSASTEAVRNDDAEPNLVKVAVGQGLADLAGAGVIEQTLRHAATTVPVQRVSVTFGRGGTPAPWILILRSRDGLADLLHASGLFAQVHTNAGIDDSLLWIQATDNRADFTKPRRVDVAAFLAEHHVVA